MPRIYCPLPLSEHAAVDLPERAVKHVQVLRFQPGDPLIVFNGRGGEYTATIEEMGRQKVSIQTHEHSPIERENAQRVHLIVGMPANERMDWLIEKATELGVNRITPLMTQRSVLKLQGERATKKTQHWQLIAIGACEQSGRNSIPMIDEPITMNHLLDEPTIDAYQMVLSTQPQPIKGTAAIQADRLVQVLSGPEGGLDPREEDALIAKGFVPWSLGSRILRAETAALMGLMALTRPT
jgi:16S rRNA (uracil1498-N3)-methyltransferase